MMLPHMNYTRLPRSTCSSVERPAVLTINRHKPWLLRAVADNKGPNDDQQPDIDALAAFLSKKAVEMRASMDELDIIMSQEDSFAADEELEAAEEAAAAAALASADAAVPAGPTAPGQTTVMSTLEMLDALDEEKTGEFIPQDFQIVKLLGKLAMQDAAAAVAEAVSGSSSPGRNAPEVQTPNIIVYAARYNSGMPYQGPVTVQLREYLKASRRVAVNELMVQQRLCGDLPQEKWQAAAADPSSTCPVVPLLGYLEAPPSDEAFAIDAEPADTLWLVYKFEGMRPMSLMLQDMDLPEEPSGIGAMFMKKEEAVAAALQSRYVLLRAIARGLLSALSYCHQRGVAHCGLGCGSVVLNTWKDREVDRLLVKLDNFGLARVYQHPLEQPQGGSSSSMNALVDSEDTDAALQRQQDLQAAALLLAEVFMVGAAEAGAEVMDVAALKRLLFDVFHEDISLFKEYCLQDEDSYSGFVDFMDDNSGAGWELLEQLMKGEVAAGQLLQSCKFFNKISSDVRVE